MSQDEYGIFPGYYPMYTASDYPSFKDASAHQRRIEFRQNLTDLDQFDCDDNDEDSIPHLMMTNSSIEDDDEDCDQVFRCSNHGQTIDSTFSRVPDAFSDSKPGDPVSSNNFLPAIKNCSSINNAWVNKNHLSTDNSSRCRFRKSNRTFHDTLRSHPGSHMPECDQTLERKFQRCWHGGYNYLSSPVPTTLQNKKQHKRWYSSDDALAESLSSTCFRKKRGHASGDSFNNLEEISFYRYSHNKHGKYLYESSSFDECKEYYSKEEESEIHPLWRTGRQHCNGHSTKKKHDFDTYLGPHTISTVYLQPIHEPSDEKPLIAPKERRFHLSQTSTFNEACSPQGKSNCVNKLEYNEYPSQYHITQTVVTENTTCSSSCSHIIPFRNNSKKFFFTKNKESTRRNKRWLLSIWKRLRNSIFGE